MKHAPTPIADNAVDLTRDWHDTDEARALIAQIIAAPIVINHRKVYVQTADCWHTYEGEAADRLRVLHERYGDAAQRTHDAAYALFVERHGREPYDAEYLELGRPLLRWCDQRVDALIDGLLMKAAE